MPEKCIHYCFLLYLFCILVLPGDGFSCHIATMPLAISDGLSLPPTWLGIQFQSAILRVSFLAYNNRNLYSVWLTTTEIYILTVLEPRGPKSRGPKVSPPGEYLFHAFSLPSGVSGNPWCPSACRCIVQFYVCHHTMFSVRACVCVCLRVHARLHVAFPSLCVSVSVSLPTCYQDGSRTGLRAHPIPL